VISGACVLTAVDIRAGCYTVNRISLAADDLRKQHMSLQTTKGSKPEESVIIDQLCFQLFLQRLSRSSLFGLGVVSSTIFFCFRSISVAFEDQQKH